MTIVELIFGCVTLIHIFSNLKPIYSNLKRVVAKLYIYKSNACTGLIKLNLFIKKIIYTKIIQRNTRSIEIKIMVSFNIYKSVNKEVIKWNCKKYAQREDCFFFKNHSFSGFRIFSVCVILLVIAAHFLQFPFTIPYTFSDTLPFRPWFLVSELKNKKRYIQKFFLFYKKI
jgi:hypothetical protein